MQGNFITGIYKITNRINGKIYIGKSKNITRRWHEHIKALNVGRHHSHKFQKEYEEFGIENFIFEIITRCPIADLDTEEVRYIDKYDSINTGYNIAGTIDDFKSDCLKNIGEKFIVDIEGLIGTGIKPSTLFRYVHLYTMVINMDNKIHKKMSITCVKDMRKYTGLQDRCYRAFIAELKELNLLNVTSQDCFSFSNKYIQKIKSINIEIPDGHIIVYKSTMKEVYDSVPLDRHKLFSSIFYVHRLFKNNKCTYKKLFDFLLPSSSEPERNISMWQSISIGGLPVLKYDKEMCYLNSYMYHNVDILGQKTNIDGAFATIDSTLMRRR